MKSLIVLLCVGFNVILFGQGVVQNLDVNLLYRGYPNKIMVGKSIPGDVVLKGENVELRKEGDVWIAIPSESTATIRAYSNEVLLQEFTYVVKPLPNPELFWGSAKSGQEANFGETFLDVRYDAAVLLNKSFKIIDWTANFDDKTISGNGNNLSSDFYSLVQRTWKDTMEVQLTVTFALDGDSRTQKTAGIFKLPINNIQGLKLSSSGKITIIDKSPTNADLFDENNPLSLMGMLKFNYFPLEYGMTDFTAKRMQDRGQIIHEKYIGEMSFKPLVSQVNPENDSTLFDPRIEVYITQYPPRPSRKYAVSSIDRIVIFEDNVRNEITRESYFGITFLGLCSYDSSNAKYDMVAVIPYNELCKMKATSFFQKFEFNGPDTVARYSSNVLEQINYYRLREEVMNQTNNRYYFDWVGGDAFEYKGFEDKRSTYFQDPKAAFLHTDRYSTIVHPKSFDFADTTSFNFREFLFQYVPSTDHIPSQDPENDFADSIIFIDGEEHYVYYPGNNFTYKALADYDVYHQYVVNADDLYHPTLKCVYFAVNNGKQSATVMAVPMENPTGDYELESIQSQLASVAIPITVRWRRTLLEEYEKGIHLDLTKSKGIKTLKNQFFLDKVNGIPINYFGL